MGSLGKVRGCNDTMMIMHVMCTVVSPTVAEDHVEHRSTMNNPISHNSPPSFALTFSASLAVQHHTDIHSHRRWRPLSNPTPTVYAPSTQSHRIVQHQSRSVGYDYRQHKIQRLTDLRLPFSFQNEDQDTTTSHCSYRYQEQ